MGNHVRSRPRVRKGDQRGIEGIIGQNAVRWSLIQFNSDHLTSKPSRRILRTTSIA